MFIHIAGISFSKQGLILVGVYVLLKILGYEGTLIAILSFLGRIYNAADLILDFLTQLWVIPIISLYTVAYLSWIFIQNSEELNQRKKFARTLSLPIWLEFLAFASSYCGILHVFVFTTSAIILGLIAAGVLNIKLDNSNSDEETEEEEKPIVSNEDEAKPVEDLDRTSESNKSILPEIKNLEQAITSDRILRIIFTLFVLLWIAKHGFVLIIVIALFLYGFIMNAGKIQQ